MKQLALIFYVLQVQFCNAQTNFECINGKPTILQKINLDLLNTPVIDSNFIGVYKQKIKIKTVNGIIVSFISFPSYLGHPLIAGTVKERMKKKFVVIEDSSQLGSKYFTGILQNTYYGEKYNFYIVNNVLQVAERMVTKKKNYTCYVYNCFYDEKKMWPYRIFQKNDVADYYFSFMYAEKNNIGFENFLIEP
jgi:hypothetical protein